MNSNASRFLGLLLETLRREYVLLGALLIGTGLRLYQLPGQILFGDEWHAIFAANRAGYFQILSHFGVSDYSIPIALYFKLAINSIGLGEYVIRTPFFLAGTLSVLIFPLLVRGLVGRFTSNLFAWLLALSPPLIFYTRFARPYAIAVCFGFIAVVLFFRWWIEPNPRYAIQYVICALISAYSLLVTLPFVLGPFIFFTAFSIGKARDQPSNATKRLTCLGLLTLLSLLLFFALPLYGDLGAISDKAVHHRIHLSVLADAFRILMGVASPLLVIPMFILVVMGLIRVYGKSRSFAAYLFVLALIQTVAILIVRPLGATSPHILSRYLLIALPPLLVFVAAGAEAIPRLFHGPFKTWMRTALPVGLCLALFLGSPVMAIMQRPNNAVTLTMLLYALEGRDYGWMLKGIPRFYETLAVHPPASLTIVEAPFIWQADHLLLYQKIHRQRTLLGLTEELCGKKAETRISMAPRLKDLPSVVNLKHVDRLLDSGVDFVIFHKDLQNEINVPLKAYASQPHITECVEQYRMRLGKPVFEDEDIIVFKLPEG